MNEETEDEKDGKDSKKAKPYRTRFDLAR